LIENNFLFIVDLKDEIGKLAHGFIKKPYDKDNLLKRIG